MSESSWVVVKRDIEVITVPYGGTMPLSSGSLVHVTQSIGGSYTVTTDMGLMCRVDAKDADAIGIMNVAPETVIDPNAPYDEKKVWEQLRTVYDPEIPVNIVDLGLIYEMKSLPLADGGKKLEIKMTMTAPGCGMGDVLKADVVRKTSAIPGVKEVAVDVVFEPQWSLDKMSEAARLQLGL